MTQENTLSTRLKEVSEVFKDNEPVKDIVKFIKVNSGRAICQPRNGR